MLNRAAPVCNEKACQQGKECNMPKYKKKTRGPGPKGVLIVRSCKATAWQSVGVEGMHSLKKLTVYEEYFTLTVHCHGRLQN